jgi:hypothetical protein
MLPQRASSEPGPWRTSRTPFAREIMDCLSDHHPAQEIVLMASVQMVKSEAGLNWAGYTIDHAPSSMLVVLPTVEVGERWSKQRLAPMIVDTPRLRSKVAPARSRDSGNTTLSKEFERRHPDHHRRELRGRAVVDADQEAPARRGRPLPARDRGRGRPGRHRGSTHLATSRTARSSRRRRRRSSRCRGSTRTGSVRPAALLRAVPALRRAAAPAVGEPAIRRRASRNRRATPASTAAR